MAESRDRFGNPIDVTVGYARGEILKSSVEESRRMEWGRRLVARRVRQLGEAGVFNLTGLIRAYPLEKEDLPALTSQPMFYAAFHGQAEELALRLMGADPDRHAAFVANRVSAGILAIMLALVPRGRTVLSVVPGGRSHPSIGRAVTLAGGQCLEVVGPDEAEAALTRTPDICLLSVTPITPAKQHLPLSDLRAILSRGHRAGLPIFVDDAHMAVRTAFFEEPPIFRLGEPDLAIFSSDKHIDGPRAGVLVGRRELVDRVKARAHELGLEAQTGHYAAVWRALQQYDPARVARVREDLPGVLAALQDRYGRERVYAAGPGVAMSAEDLLEVAWGGTKSPCPVAPVEASSCLSMILLQEYGIVTIPVLGMPGCSPTLRLTLYPDGRRFGLGALADAVVAGIRRLAGSLRDPAEVRRLVLGA